VEAIHLAALYILETIGVRCAVPEAQAIFRTAGATIDPIDGRIRLGRDIVMAALARTPSEFALVPRNAARSCRIGGNYLATAAVLGPPNCSDLLRGRRSGTLADLSELLKLTQSFNVIQMNGWPVEPLDIEVRHRHLEAAFAMLALTDKVPYVFCQSRQRIEDVLTMCAIARGETLEEFGQRPGVFSIINTNTPLQYDVPMTIGVIDMARHGQPTLLTPFVMAGASTPNTIASAMAVTCAEIPFGDARPTPLPGSAGDVRLCLHADMKTAHWLMAWPTYETIIIGGQMSGATDCHCVLESVLPIFLTLGRVMNRPMLFRVRCRQAPIC
jgi:trimethylamine--corrinoid protein Co-methyltransferase